MKQWPQEIWNGITTRSPTASRDTFEPTSSTTPIGSCPRMSPAFMNAPRVSYRCRSDPQMLVEVIRTMASLGCSIRGSGTSSTDTLRLPCHVTALMVALSWCWSSAGFLGLYAVYLMSGPLRVAREVNHVGPVSN